ncbi:MAG: adenylyl-sulfate kinase [Myxococcota bacterium]
MGKSSNVTWHAGHVTAEDRYKLMNCKGCLLWFTGLSGSGKSTVARALESKLVSLGFPAYVLDGDNIRHGLNGDLGFSPEDRKENIRRITEVASLFVDAGMITVTAFISPYQEDRDFARQHLKQGQFFEIHISTSIEACEARDPKGLYQKVRQGVIKEFTGIDAPYEAPTSPELRVDTENMTIAQSVGALVELLEANGVITIP